MPVKLISGAHFVIPFCILVLQIPEYPDCIGGAGDLE